MARNVSLQLFGGRHPQYPAESIGSIGWVYQLAALAAYQWLAWLAQWRNTAYRSVSNAAVKRSNGGWHQRIWRRLIMAKANRILA